VGRAPPSDQNRIAVQTESAEAVGRFAIPLLEEGFTMKSLGRGGRVDGDPVPADSSGVAFRG
jgi:hypothetical protein